MAQVLRPEDLDEAITSDALDDIGYVMEYTSSGIQKHSGTAGKPIAGIAYKSTKNPITGTAEANKHVALVRYGVARVKLKSANAAITRGDFVGAVSGGVVDKWTYPTVSSTPTQAEVEALLKQLDIRVGVALEAKASSAGGSILVQLTLK